MKNWLNNKWPLLVLRIVIGGVFIYAGFTKIQNAQAFADSIHTFKTLPDELINLLALSLPPFEIIVGLMLLIGWNKRSAMFSTLILCSVFILALVQALLRGLSVDCGCFGSGQPSTWKTWFTLGRDILLIAATWFLYCKTLQEKIFKAH